MAQLYYHQRVSSVTVYEMNLCGFERVHLAPGESRRVSFTVPAARLELVDRAFRRVVEPGVYDVMVGSSSAVADLHGQFTVKH